MTLFFSNDTATTEMFTLSLHDALPISGCLDCMVAESGGFPKRRLACWANAPAVARGGHQCGQGRPRSEEHTSELQSRLHLVCRLLLEKKKAAGSKTAGVKLGILIAQFS